MKGKRKKPAIPKANLIASDLAACKNAFDNAKIPWVIIDGIVLGYARHGGIIPWDTDLDIGIFRELTNAEWLRLYTAMKNEGFGFKNLKQDFVYGRRRVKLNMWMYHRNGTFYEAFPKITPDVKFVEKAEWYENPQLLLFLGKKYPMPANLEDYLLHRYGKDHMEAKYTHDEWRLIKFGTQSPRYEPDVWLGSRCGPKGDLWPRIMRREEAPRV